MNCQISIIPFEDQYASDFYEINKQWISSMFAMESVDEQVLANPYEFILAGGGYIWLAQHSELGVVGTIALKKDEQGRCELTKMGVFETARGLKIGETLLKFVVEFVNCKRLQCYLLTNAKCEVAIHLYEKYGFVHDAEVLAQQGPMYARCNVAMSLIKQS